MFISNEPRDKKSWMLLLSYFITDTHLDIVDKSDFNTVSSFTGINASRKHVIQGGRHVGNCVSTLTSVRLSNRTYSSSLRVDVKQKYIRALF